MNFPVNKPLLLKATAAVIVGLTITAVPRSSYYYGVGVAQLLTLNDSATFAGATTGNIVWTAPVTALTVGTVVSIPVTTSNGLVVSAVPPGVAFMLNYDA